MALHPGNIQGYNNEIQITGSDAAIGHNPGINEAELIASQGDKAFQGKIASPAGTVHKGPQPSQNKTRVRAADSDGTSAETRQSATANEEEKTALVAVGVVGGLTALWNIKLNVPARSIKGILMLFENVAAQKPFACNTEAFYNP